MTEHFIQLFLHIQRFGFWKGLSLYFQKTKKTGVSEVHIPGYTNPVYLRNNSSDWPTFRQIFLRQDYNINLGFTPKTIIDCGANIGLGIVYFKNKYPDAKVVAIEPESGNFELIKKNTEKFKDIHPVKAGVWNRTTNLEIIPGKDNGNWSFSVKETDHPNEKTIPSVCIADLMKQHGINEIDLLKIDIEGAELELFSNNYESWLPRTKALIIETHDQDRRGTTRPFFTTISKYNFSTTISGENFVCIRED